VDVIAALLRWLERRRRFKAALAYNTNYTWYIHGPSASTWMCPCCCRIQHAHSTSRFTGPQFAACCTLPAGGRTERRFAVPLY
jgi:hypothetical protein